MNTKNEEVPQDEGFYNNRSQFITRSTICHPYHTPMDIHILPESPPTKDQDFEANFCQPKNKDASSFVGNENGHTDHRATHVHGKQEYTPILYGRG